MQYCDYHRVGAMGVLSSTFLRRAGLGIVALGVLIALVGCGDPYEKRLPASSLLAEGQVDSIAQQLSSQDGEMFRRWAERMATGQRLSGETPAMTVKIALIYQKRFEEEERARIAANASAARAARAADEAERAEQEAYALEQALRARANETISQVAQVDIRSFEFSPIYGATGIEIGREWIFHLIIENRSEMDITGLRGTLLLADQFAEHSYRAEGQINVLVPVGAKVESDVSIKHDERNKLFAAMRSGSRVSYEWELYSVAFQDGTVFDYTHLTDSEVSPKG